MLSRSASREAAAGAVLASAALPVLRHLLPADFPESARNRIDVDRDRVRRRDRERGVALVAGVVPMGTTAAVQSHNRVSSGRDARRLRTLLVAGEVTLAGLLCAGTFFLLRSYQEIDSRDHGFRPAGVLTFEVAAPRGTRADREQSTKLLENVRLSLKNVPGVAFAGASTNLPWSGYDENTSLSIAGRTTKDADAANSARYQAASPEYFEAAGMRLLRRQALRRQPRCCREAAHDYRERCVGAPLSAWRERSGRRLERLG